MDRTAAVTPVPEPRAPGAAREQRTASAETAKSPGSPAQEAPGGQLVVGAIPGQPPGFQPRPDLMTRLNRADHAVSVLIGDQGTGKTELAAAYARAKLAGGWRLVAWVNAGDTGSLLGDLAAVADAAGLSDASVRDAADAGRAVRRWLEADGDRRLLVFDNAGDPDALRPFIPASGVARVLITSTEPSLADLGTSVRTAVFTADEALAVLSGRTDLSDDTAASAVAAELGYLPLALATAAGVIAGRRLGHEAYLERLRALSAGEHPARGEGQPGPSGVAEAVLLALDEARASGQAGVCAGVTEMIAVLSAAGVRRDLLHVAGQAGALASRQRVGTDVVDAAVERLSDLSLVTVSLDGRTVVMHDLVRQVVRETLERQERLTAVCRAAAAVLEAHAGTLAGSQDRRSVRDFPRQVMALLDNTPLSVAEADAELARAFFRLRFLALYHLIELGDSAQAIAVGKPLAADLEWVLGPDHPDTLNALNSLAAAYLAAGRAAEAVALFEQTLAGRERLLGADHPDTLNSRNNLATAYQGTGRVAEAVPLFEQTLAARQRLLGVNHRNTVNTRGSLAAAYRDAGRTVEAIPLFEQTLAARERLLGLDHPDTLRSRNNLANAYRETGRIPEAIPVVEQILASRERLLGADHPRTLGARNNLAIAYRDVGRIAEAVELFERNLAVCERLLGADHPRTLSTRDSLAACRDAVRAAKAAAGEVSEQA